MVVDGFRIVNDPRIEMCHKGSSGVCDVAGDDDDDPDDDDDDDDDTGGDEGDDDQRQGFDNLNHYAPQRWSL